MNDGDLLGITSYPQLLRVMEKLREQLLQDIEANQKKLPILKANLIRVERALHILKTPPKNRRVSRGNISWWTPERRAIQAERARAINAKRRSERQAAAETAGAHG